MTAVPGADWPGFRCPARYCSGVGRRLAAFTLAVGKDRVDGGDQFRAVVEGSGFVCPPGQDGGGGLLQAGCLAARSESLIAQAACEISAVPDVATGIENFLRAIMAACRCSTAAERLALSEDQLSAGQALRPQTATVARNYGIPVMPSPTNSADSLSCPLGRDPAQVRHARERTRKALCDWGLGEHADLAALLVSELVTNAIRHGGGSSRMGVSHSSGVLRVEVHDDGAARPVRRQPGVDDEAGRGLALIDGLIELQGGERGMAEDSSGPGKTVYVMIRLADDAAGTW